MNPATTRIVIPGDFPPQIQGSPHLERLKPYGQVVLYTDRPATLEERVRRAQGATCLINSRSNLQWHKNALDQLPDLRMISICGIGTDAIGLETCQARGIVVSNIPDRTAPIVAEHALGLLFAVAKRAWFHTQELKSGRWTSRDNVFLHGKTLGIIGMGSIGTAMARLGKALGMNVVAWTMNPSAERGQQLGVPFLSLEDLLRAADAVSLHVKLTDRTRGLLGAREIGWMKPGALLINTARGAVVDTAALVHALNAGKLGGAGLDVFDVEPLPADHPLLACDQVVLTPHNADQTPEGLDILNAGVVDNVIAFLEGRPTNRVV